MKRRRFSFLVTVLVFGVQKVQKLRRGMGRVVRRRRFRLLVRLLGEVPSVMRGVRTGYGRRSGCIRRWGRVLPGRRPFMVFQGYSPLLNPVPILVSAVHRGSVKTR